MAARGTAAHRTPGNPLGGILRDLNRKARASTTGSAQGGGHPGPPGEQGERGPAGKRGAPGAQVLAAVVVTDEDGRAVWAYGTELAAPPILGAVAVNQGRDGATVTVAIEEVTTAGAVVQVWRSRPLLGLGLLPSVPAGPGVVVHVTATPATTPKPL